MVDSTVSGVLFTANPKTGRRSEAVIASAFGLGEGVVVRQEIQPKHARITLDATQGHGTTTVEVPEPFASQLNGKRYDSLQANANKLASEEAPTAGAASSPLLPG